MIERIGGGLGLDANAPTHQKPDDPMVLPVDGDIAFGIRMNFPYPDARALQQLTQFAFWWPNALSDLARHKAHMIVMCPWSKHSRLEAHMRHLVLVHELVRQLPVIGVLWGSSLVQTAAFKGECANAQQGGFPFSLWVLIQYSKQPNGNILISTLGMRDFEKMEIETESSLPLDKTFDLVRKFGSYVLGTGAVVKDGDTMGPSESEKIKVRHARSFRPDVNEPVYWLELTDQPTIQKPKEIFGSLFGSRSKQCAMPATESTVAQQAAQWPASARCYALPQRYRMQKDPWRDTMSRRT
jgi:hypothetical protein